MLRRASSDAARRNNLESSSTSNSRKPGDRKSGPVENFDQDGGYQGALVAANTAYQRAHGTAIPREKGRVTNKLQKNRTGTSSEGSHLAQRRRGRLRKSTSSDVGLVLHQRGLQRYRDGSENGSSERGGLSGGSGTRPESPISRAKDFLETDAQLRVQSTAEEKIASAPSSYRKLPKSPSVQVPKSNGTTMQTCKPRGQNNEDDEARALEGSLSHTRSKNRFVGSDVSDGLSVPSTSFLNDEQSRDINRDKILRNFQQIKLQERPSLSSLVARRRQDHVPSQSSFESPSNVTFYSEGVQTSDKVGHSSFANGADNKAKDNSKSLKTRLKKIFQKSSHTGDGLPVQQIDATKLHFGSDITSITSSKRRSDSFTGSEEKNLLRDSPEISYLTDTSLLEKNAKQRISSGAYSEGGDSNTKSRVTSWSNSTVANTLSSKPLSIINECVSRAQSVSLSHRTASNGSEHARPLIQPTHAFGQSTEYNGIDARRLCSALMRNEAEKESLQRPCLMQDDSPKFGILSNAHQSLPSQSRNTSLSSLATRLRLPRGNCERAGPQDENFGKEYHEDADSTPILLKHKSPTSTLNNLTPKKNKLVVPKRRVGAVSKLASPSAEDIARRIHRDQNRWKATLEDDRAADRITEIPHHRQFEDLRGRNEGSPGQVKASCNETDRSYVTSISFRLGGEDRSSREYSLNPRLREDDAEAVISNNHRNYLVDVNNNEKEAFLRGNKYSNPDVPYDVLKSSPDANQSVQGLRNALKPKFNPDRDADTTLRETPYPRGHRRERAQINDTEPSSQKSAEIVVAKKKESNSRPRLENRTSSRMNERFPMIETGRDQYFQSKLLDNATQSNTKKAVDVEDKENQARLVSNGNQLIHNRFRSLQTVKAVPNSDTVSDESKILRSNYLHSEANLENKTDFYPRPSPLRHNLRPQTNKAKSIVDLRSQSYSASRMGQLPLASQSTSPYRQIRRKPTAMAALNTSAAVTQLLGKSDQRNDVDTHAWGTSSSFLAATNTAALSPARANKMNTRSYTADLHKIYTSEELPFARSTVENKQPQPQPQPQTPSPSRSHSRSRLGGSVTPTSGQRMADVFIHSRLREQQLQRQHQQLPWLRQAGDSPVFL